MSPSSEMATVIAEESTRKLTILTGVMLLLGFFLPIVDVSYGFWGRGGATLVFPNIKLLGESHIPATLVLELIFPLVAGIVVLVFAGMKMGLSRSITFIVLALLPVIILISDDRVVSFFNNFSNQISKTGSGATAMFFGFLGWMGILAGAYSMRLNSTRKIAAIVAAVGAGLYLIFQVIPSNDEVPVVQAFKLLFSDKESKGFLNILGLATLTQLALMIAASIIAFTILPESVISEWKPARIMLLWMLATIVMIVPVIYFCIVSLSEGGQYAFGLASNVFLIALKIGSWLYGIILMGTLGLGELMATSNWGGGAISSQHMSPTVTNSHGSIEEKLTELKQLLDKEFITAEDYEEKKKQILRDY